MSLLNVARLNSRELSLSSAGAIMCARQIRYIDMHTLKPRNAIARMGNGRIVNQTLLIVLPSSNNVYYSDTMRRGAYFEVPISVILNYRLHSTIAISIQHNTQW